ncbi:MAG TPA: protein kinase [Kofleriaceae bacterium]|nr:protein kinase [Kofleriaceae bacterium]
MITLGEGTTIGQYLIGAKIGEGGMGAVYRATHTLLGRPAAIKLLLPALSQQREVVDRLFNEARATTSVSDPGIVSVFDFGFHTDGSAYIVMELLEGEPLDARILRGTISIADALRITRQVAGALGAAHARGIVHRDLKPENIFLVRDAEAQGGERPKILDFGIAKLTRPGDNGDKKRTRTGLLLGTPIYMSPEQCRGAGDVDLRADIYALGCVLYHLVVGRPPFDHEGIGEIISAHLRETPKPPSAVVGGVPAAVDALVLKCLAKDPAQRFQSMQGLQQACEAQLARISGGGAPTIALANLPTVVVPGAQTTMRGAAGEVLAPPRRRDWLAAAGLVVLAAAALAAVALRSQGDEPPVPQPVAARPIDAAVIVVDATPDAPAAAAPDASPLDAAPVPEKHVARPHRHPAKAAVVQPVKPAEDPYDSR